MHFFIAKATESVILTGIEAKQYIQAIAYNAIRRDDGVVEDKYVEALFSFDRNRDVLNSSPD